MFGKREITVKMSKKGGDEDTSLEPADYRPVEEKVAAVLHVFDKPIVKVFGAVCIFIILDTHRQVAVAKANNPR